MSLFPSATFLFTHLQSSGHEIRPIIIIIVVILQS